MLYSPQQNERYPALLEGVSRDGRIFLISVRDSRGLAKMLEAPHPEDEARIIDELCALIGPVQTLVTPGAR